MTTVLGFGHIEIAPAMSDGFAHMAKSRNSVLGPGPAKSTSYGQHTRGIHRKGTREYSLASQAVFSSGFSVNSSGVLTVTGRFNRPRS